VLFSCSFLGRTLDENTDSIRFAEAPSQSQEQPDVIDLGKEIDRLERQQALDAELNKPINTPITGKPNQPNGETKPAEPVMSTSVPSGT